MKAKLLLIGAILSIVFATTACNKTQTAVEPANIHMMLFEPSNDAPTSFEIDQIIQDTAKNFEKLNPQIKVTIDHMPQTTKTDDIINLLKSNDPPDIIPYGISSIDKADKEGVLLDLLTLQTSGSKDIDISKNVLDSVIFHGKLLVLPFSTIPKAILYNKSLFDSKNIPYPQNDWTWEQFRSISQKLLPAHGSSLPYDIGFFEILLASAGKNLLSSDGSTSIGYLDSPEAVHVIQWLNAYYHDDKEKTAPLSQLDGGKQFNNLQSGMVLGILDSYTFFKIKLGDTLGVAPLPHFEGNKQAIPLYFQGYGIARKSKQHEAAWSFLQYLTLTNQDNTKKFAQYYLTTSKSIADSVHQDKDPVKSIFSGEINYAVKPSGYINPLLFEAWNSDLNTKFQNLLTTDDSHVPTKLHDIALKLDQEMTRLKNINSQSTESPSP